ncbi:MAG: hypothetical protein IJZ55_13975 [Lachnospiraceae bacterium]|nr:hypothetical protein [Lachnospiraceae bacterium]
MRKTKLGKKIATVAMVLAATVMVTAPTTALAVTTPNKGCPANAANGYHNYVYKCTGSYVISDSYEHEYGWFWDRNTCKVTFNMYGCVEVCDLCGLSLGNPGVTHPHKLTHSSCGKDDPSWCNGPGSYVTYLR